ncbi:hypothetical protein RIR_jg34929.t1 [Rhizophagus irregularis DAOM 181602=DAOM 197198]|nr:hypothetical protein RIR_jg34929.t1 [Rhizophagus irregularis DAOM 181602=DAOM 197198]
MISTLLKIQNNNTFLLLIKNNGMAKNNRHLILTPILRKCKNHNIILVGINFPKRKCETSAIGVISGPSFRI